MNLRLPPGLKRRQYRTRAGYKRTLYYPRFTCWDGVRRTFPPGLDDINAAKDRLARLKVQNADRRDFTKDESAAAARLFAWVEKYLSAKRGTPSHSRYAIATRRLKDALGDVMLAAITNSMLLDYRQKRRVDGVTPATVNREMLSLRSLLRMAHQNGALEKLPAIPFEAEHNERTRTATAGEYRRILKLLSVDDRDFAEIIREMGFRPGEILEITPADLVTRERAIDMSRIRKKRGLKRALPLSSRAWSILSRRAKQRAPAERLFPFSRHQARHAFERACKALGIHDLWLYDLKATFATEKQREGWPEKIIMEFTGHRTNFAFRRYSRPTLEDLRIFISRPGGKKGLNWTHGGNTKPARSRRSQVTT